MDPLLDPESVEHWTPPVPQPVKPAAVQADRNPETASTAEDLGVSSQNMRAGELESGLSLLRKEMKGTHERIVQLSRECYEKRFTGVSAGISLGLVVSAAGLAGIDMLLVSAGLPKIPGIIAFSVIGVAVVSGGAVCRHIMSRRNEPKEREIESLTDAQREQIQRLCEFPDDMLEPGELEAKAEFLRGRAVTMSRAPAGNQVRF